MRENDNVETLSAKVSNKIKQRILAGEWCVGDKIPNEQILAGQMNVSRTTIREAIKILVSAQILHIRRGVGTYVANMPDVISDSENPLNGDSAVIIHDILECRSYLEPVACMLAADRAKENQLTEMEGIILEMKHISEEMKIRANRSVLIDRLAMLEMQFHTLLYRMTNNAMFQRMGQIMNNTVLETYMTDYYRSGVLNSTLEYVSVHAEIYDAICTRDRERARVASLKHMETPFLSLTGSVSKP